MEEKRVVDLLVEELEESPESAIKLMQSMRSVVRPWEEAKQDGQTVVSLFTRTSVMGEEVAVIQRSAPTWVIRILGENFTDERVFNSSTAEKTAKSIVDRALQEEGYILMDPSEG